jgi:FAD/FMN-containing dehydrogenase
MPVERRRRVSLTPRGGLAHAEADDYYLPRSEDEAREALELARGRAAAGEFALTLSGAERSFESHFLPVEQAGSRVLLSARRLRGDVCVLGQGTDASGEPVLRVRARAGTSFAELLRVVHASGADVMPFSCPTADAISLGGALAVNTHSRTSATYGGLFGERVRRFRLLSPLGEVHDCHAEAPRALERELFRTVPGALGALGLVTELELELCAVSPHAEVIAEVLSAFERAPGAAAGEYLERVAANRAQGFRPWTEGLSLVLLGSPSRGTAVVMGRRRAGQREPRRSTLPLFRESGGLNLLVQGVSHRVPAFAHAVTRRLLRPGKSFTARYDRWAFFQSSFDHGSERLGLRPPPLWDVLGLDSRLGLVHQGWVVGAAGLASFLELAAELFERPEYAPAAADLEFFDALPLPPPARPLDAAQLVRGEAHVCTLSIAVRDPHGKHAAMGLCHDLSESAHARGLPVVVQLNKQHHVSQTTLRAMHAPALRALSRLKAELDPEAVIRSRTLERLGIGP